MEGGKKESDAPQLPSPEPWDGRGYKPLCKTSTLGGTPPPAPAHQILGASPSPRPSRPGNGNKAIASASPPTSLKYKRKSGAETCKTLAVLQPPSSVSLLHTPFLIWAPTLHPLTESQVGRSLPWGCGVRVKSMAPELEDIDPMTIAVLPFFVWGADYRLRDPEPGGGGGVGGWGGGGGGGISE